MVGLLDIILGVVLLVIVILVVIVIGVYNGLISKRNRVQDASAQIDVQLKRRYDLIPNLINTVKGYMKYEQKVLTQVTALRSSIVTGSMQDKAQANNQISQALKSIFAVAENYPDLKASENFKDLQSQLEDTEDKIAFVRTSYNDYVLDYNNTIQQFPGAMFASSFGFQKADFFQTPEEQKEPVSVNFDDVNGPNPGTTATKPSAKRAPKAPPPSPPS